MNRKLILFLTITLTFITFSSTFAGITFENVFVSRYIWRGFDLTDNKPCMQPSITFHDERTGLSLNFWNSTGIDRDKTKGADEWDFSIGYSKNISNVVF